MVLPSRTDISMGHSNHAVRGVWPENKVSKLPVSQLCTNRSQYKIIWLNRAYCGFRDTVCHFDEPEVTIPLLDSIS